MADWQYLTVPHLGRKQLRRIFSKIRLDPTTGCWVWTGALNIGGYGQTSVMNIRSPIHRLLYAWLVEPIPKGVGRDIPQLDHIVCDNRKCVNPSHVKLVTARENILRGKGQSAKWAARTCCKNGHPLLPAPTSDGIFRRRCRICDSHRDARQLALHRAAQLRYTARMKLGHTPRHKRPANH